jgi:ABC-type lipoprotein export system ATPase subunit/ABC-type antimicrobial peptide transport system permease subunit
MLQLNRISKTYTTAGFTQVALDGVSISFRDNEFVAVLGPSGSGKTTMLNIIGGLDHYDSGDLVVDGISTSKYRDRDWDTYRNNRVGFVFQSYNLIPHQTVLANVELALTLSGVSRKERRVRAKAALDEVGLSDHINKKPSQLSGGQMQRVAVARALINDPEILLADEPTGALDSKTSTQTMDLLVKIAKDRLVVMVTHNPELAEGYANRTVSLHDGEVVGDSNPYYPAKGMAVSDKQVNPTRMSFFTAVALSFKNLMTKKGRTLMTAFAGSIGIVGIAAILALANGVNSYIKHVEEDTLSIYPLSINSVGMDLTSLLVMSSGESSSSGDDDNEGAQGERGSGMFGSMFATEEAAGEQPTSARESKMLTSLLSRVENNDLKSLKTFFDSDGDGVGNYVNTIQYSYPVTPQIFDANTANGVRQVNPNRSFAALGFGSDAGSSSLMSFGMSADVFAELTDDPTIFAEQYDVVAGHIPQSNNELMLVLNPSGGVSDLLLYTMGLRDPAELESLLAKFSTEGEVKIPTDRKDVPFADILNVSFKLVPAYNFYTYDKEFGVWTDRHADEKYMKDVVNDGYTLRIVGILKPKPEATVSMLSPLIYYRSGLIHNLMAEADNAKIVKDQLAKPDVDVFSGKTFEMLNDEAESQAMDMSSFFSIDEEAISKAFAFDTSALASDASAFSGLNLDSSISAGLNAGQLELPQMDLLAILSGLDVEVDTALLAASLTAILNDYMIWALDPANGIDISDTAALTAGFLTYVQDPAIQAQIATEVGNAVDLADVQSQLQDILQAYLQTAVTSYLQTTMQVMASTIQSQVSGALQSSMSQLASNMSNAMSIDQQAFMDAFQFNLSEEELARIMMSFMGSEDASKDNNLRKLGYASPDNPSGISIYPIDFESKEHIIQILDDYNARMEANDTKDRVIVYTDIVGVLMSSVTTIIDMVSYVLIAFVTISLVVSSIMIGVITYISVLERKKEIGILRAIGASKGNIANVFNAETLIVGFVAGLLGIGITMLLTMPANIIIYNMFDIPNIAILPWQPAIGLVLVSMALTFIAGLIPSSAASRKDPVEALRSE